MSKLIRAVREFWFNNEAGPFMLDDYPVARAGIHKYGGPAREFDACPVCQKAEWISRLEQRPLFVGHKCPTAADCKVQCERQGDDMWSPFHQDFWFAFKCDSRLNAPRGIFVLPRARYGFLYERFMRRHCDGWFNAMRRGFAQACQLEVVESGQNVQWSDYDFLFMQNMGALTPRFEHPHIPIIMCASDFWGDTTKSQAVLDWLEPKVLLSPVAIAWRQNYVLSGITDCRLYPSATSRFFTRPNLSVDKQLDLLVVGKLAGSMYPQRKVLEAQARTLPSRYKIEYSHEHGEGRNVHVGPVSFPGRSGVMRYLNAWSAYFGSARYVVFGSGNMSPRPVFMKHYEALGSGAVPILPDAPELEELGLRPMEHYIPLAEVFQKNERLMHFLDNYERYKVVAENAVAWHQQTVDHLLFDGLEDAVRDVTDFRYPKRLI